MVVLGFEDKFRFIVIKILILIVNFYIYKKKLKVYILK